MMLKADPCVEKICPKTRKNRLLSTSRVDDIILGTMTTSPIDRSDQRTPRRTACYMAALLVVAFLSFPAYGDILYTGEDIMATTSSPHPVSAAAAASFDSAITALGGGSLITFESAPLGSFSSLTVAPGVTLTGSDLDGNNQTIRDTSNLPGFPTLDGYNTTPGGANFVEVQAGTLTFTFANPIQAFGAYFSGIQTVFFSDTITFSDGSSEQIFIPGAGTSSSAGALSFVGFTDVGKSITSVTLNAGSLSTGADFIGVDDVLFQTVPTTPVPEPGAIVLLLTICVLLALGVRQRYLIR